MARPEQTWILTINTGSSSLKAGVYRNSPRPSLEYSIEVERIGLDGGSFKIVDATGRSMLASPERLANHQAALSRLVNWLKQRGVADSLVAIGHRVVYGGITYRDPQPVTAPMLDALRELVPIDPDHLPQAIDAIESTGREFPGLPQIACFDTAFHQTMPRLAQLYPLPEKYWDAGIRRLGFHGLSYEYIVETLRSENPAAIRGPLIIAHLGNGASLAAVRDGQSVDTTMGFTPTGGLVMGTRTGDLDPGVVLYLLQSGGMTATAVSQLLNAEAGLRGVSGGSADVRDLLDREASDPRAADALNLFCYQARKFIGALAASLGGLDLLVFTAGIGAHAAPIRERICAQLGFLGIALDPERNRRSDPLISADTSRVAVRVMQTDEDQMIARHTQRLIPVGG